VWLLDVVVFYLGTRLTLGSSCVGLRVGNSVGLCRMAVAVQSN